jgi:hypothetical protein
MVVAELAVVSVEVVLFDLLVVVLPALLEAVERPLLLLADVFSVVPLSFSCDQQTNTLPLIKGSISN